MKSLDVTGHRFGRLTAVVATPTIKGRFWLCSCDCGNQKLARLGNLRHGGIKSCGCLRSENGKLYGGLNGRKGPALPDGTFHTAHPLYWIHRAMLQRCYDKKNTNYRKYGAKGIRVCAEWRKNFVSFVRDIGPRPSKQHSVDRINNRGNYTPKNCRWATGSEQAANRSNTKRITWRGETRTAVEWAAILGMQYKTLFARFGLGWSLEKIMTTPLKNHSSRRRKS